MPPSPRNGRRIGRRNRESVGDEVELRPLEREELGRDAELEHGQPVGGEGDDEGRGFEHGRILPDFGIPANS